MTIAVLDLLNLITLIVAGTLIIMFLSRVRQSLSYLFLATFLFCYVSGATVPLMLRGGIYAEFPFWIYAPTNLSILSLPFLHVFLKTLAGEFNSKRLGWTFIIPILVILSQIYFWSIPIEEKLEQLNDGRWSMVYYRYRFIDFLYTLFMIVITLTTVNRYQRNIDQYYSEGLPKGFRWVRSICYFLAIIMTPMMIPRSVFPDEVFGYMGITFVSLAILMMLWIGVNGMNQPFMYLKKSSPQTDENEINNEEDSLSTKASDLLDEIVEEIRTKQLYRAVNLNLDELARQLKISPRKLSTLINQESGKNFRNFINSFRIAHAKDQLKSGALENMSMNGLAREAGFKSRTTFYAAFKADVGCTPLVYLELNKLDKGEVLS